jgi:3-hydroxymyristoyl/3-hydroxydecanoyl-(acyl carrier protein) dehydratase
MKADKNNYALDRYSNWATAHSMQVSALHQNMLSLQKSSLANLSNKINKNIADIQQNNYGSMFLFDKNWLNEFALGDIVATLGSEFSIYNKRRCPRIPNGDLLMMTGIRAIHGVRGEFREPSVILADYDVPLDAWFLEGSPTGNIPFSLVLEIALQPCGVLSAWLGTQLQLPQIDFFFRNLDGEVLLHKNINARGKTINTRAVLQNTVLSGTTIIQHFEFELSIEGTKFFSGTSSFGYFPEDSMASQSGLDGGKTSQPWGLNSINAPSTKLISKSDLLNNPNLPAGKLLLVDNVSIVENGGEQSLGYAVTEKQNHPEDWFYKNHFFQDPVMPGSLGIEATLQLLVTLFTNITKSLKPIFIVPGIPVRWKYRGQVLPKNDVMRAETHIISRQSKDNRLVITANANVWADNIRIYEISNISLMQ